MFARAVSDGRAVWRTRKRKGSKVDDIGVYGGTLQSPSTFPVIHAGLRAALPAAKASPSFLVRGVTLLGSNRPHVIALQIQRLTKPFSRGT